MQYILCNYLLDSENSSYCISGNGVCLRLTYAVRWQLRPNLSEDTLCFLGHKRKRLSEKRTFVCVSVDTTRTQTQQISFCVQFRHTKFDEKHKHIQVFGGTLSFLLCRAFDTNIYSKPIRWSPFVKEFQISNRNLPSHQDFKLAHNYSLPSLLSCGVDGHVWPEHHAPRAAEDKCILPLKAHDGHQSKIRIALSPPSWSRPYTPRIWGKQVRRRTRQQHLRRIFRWWRSLGNGRRCSSCWRLAYYGGSGCCTPPLRNRRGGGQSMLARTNGRAFGGQGSLLRDRGLSYCRIQMGGLQNSFVSCFILLTKSTSTWWTLSRRDGGRNGTKTTDAMLESLSLALTSRC